jgi:hypothetical protein
MVNIGTGDSLLLLGWGVEREIKVGGIFGFLALWLNETQRDSISDAAIPSGGAKVGGPDFEAAFAGMNTVGSARSGKRPLN